MVTLSLAQERKHYKTFEEAATVLLGRFSHLEIAPRLTYTVKEVLVTWFMVYNGKTCVGSLYESSSLLVHEHVECLAYPQTELGVREGINGRYPNGKGK
jgi:hypothetical protein